METPESANSARAAADDGDDWLHSRANYLAVLVAALAGLAISIVSTAWHGVPEPRFHDEHSYLLAADTFCHGRLSNPEHPLRHHFERFHVLQEPTYSSKYPPGQGLLLAAGQALGHPIVGVWFGVAAMCAAIAWLLLGWFGTRWAVFGGLLTAAHYGLLSYWSLSYWGGALAAAGGALVFGATRRLAIRPTFGLSILLGIGLAILANTRPFEGLLMTLLCSAIVAATLHVEADRSVCRRAVRVTSIGTVGVLMLAAAWMLFYNDRVTESAWTMPYQVYQQQYSPVPQFLWSERTPQPEYRTPQQARVWEFAAQRFDQLQSFDQQVRENAQRGYDIWRFFVGWSLLLPLPASFASRHRRWVWLVVGMLAVFGAVFWGYQGFHVHYLAPMAGPLVFLLVAGTEAIASRWPSRGGHWVWIGLCLGLLTADVGERLLRPDQKLEIGESRVATGVQSDVTTRLVDLGGRHLVLVDLDDDVSVHDEWITNGADIDGQTIVWARDLGDDRNRAIRDFYADRWIWRLEVRLTGARLVPVTGPRVLRE